MGVKTRIEPLDSWVRVVVDEELAPQTRSAAVARFARERIDETRNANQRVLGRATPAKVFVDGREGAALESVNPDRGRIVAEFDLVLDVLNWILNRLRESSPVISGKYREGHRLFADGTEVAVSGAIPQAEEFAFTNTMPYARRLEIGKTKSGRAFVVQVEPRIYERVAKEARSRFGNIAQIGYTFRPLLGARRGVGPKPGRETRRRSADMRYPTITVRLR